MGTERILIFNAHLFTAIDHWQPGWLLSEGRTIQLMGAGHPPDFDPGSISSRIDAGGRMLFPGFIDLHAHGAVGYETMDASETGLAEMARFYARHGVTAFLAATWTAPHHQILRTLQNIAQNQGRLPGGATLLGAYLEGPYLNPEKCGAQDASLIRRAIPQEALEYLETGCIRVLALAPEFPENGWLIKECVRRGITVSAGHTAASFAEMHTAVQQGLRHVTHCYNGMLGFGHREPGTVGAALALPELSCELIADNIHVHPVAQRILVDLKGPQRVILVSDAIRGAGLPDGEYDLGGRTVTIQHGEVRLPDGRLSGSVLTMERAFQNAYLATQRPLQEIWCMTSLNAARAIGVAARKGSLEIGKDADLVLLDEHFQVCLTMVEGEIIYTA